MHSPWGMRYNIIKELGWTWDYLMWGISWVNIEMMLADAPKYKTKKTPEGEGIKTATSYEDYKDFGD